MDDHETIVLRERLQALSDRLTLDPASRAARVQASIAAYENARLDGLCHAGAWECALEVMDSFVGAARPAHG